MINTIYRTEVQILGVSFKSARTHIYKVAALYSLGGVTWDTKVIKLLGLLAHQN